MRAILVVFMTRHLMNASGSLEPMSDEEAKYWYHIFLSSVYFFPTMGALLSDAVLGKYRTIFWLSLVYCAGHAALAMDETRLGLGIGLTLIAIGSGGIKPCVSANVGDQFGAQNKHLLEKVYSWFYFSINFGAFFSTLLTPYLLVHYGPSWAFGVPGIFMALATLVFWAGRRKFVHVPPGGVGFLKEAFSRDGLAVLGKLVLIYAFVAVFWSLYDQTGSAWILQAENMNRQFFGTELSAAQTHAANPIMILTFIPIFTYVIYPAINKVFPLTYLRKIGIGFFLTAAAFCFSAVIEGWIADGGRPQIAWQFLAYAVMTAGEVMVSITGLEFSYTQAPPRLKSVVMSLWLLSVSAGNGITAVINLAIQDEAGKSRLTGPDYYWLFAALMVATAVVFIFVALFYRERTFTQDDSASIAEAD
jgi:POT family proton-dependent oligopeptide transporter